MRERKDELNVRCEMCPREQRVFVYLVVHTVVQVYRYTGVRYAHIEFMHTLTLDVQKAKVNNNII